MNVTITISDLRCSPGLYSRPTSIVTLNRKNLTEYMTLDNFTLINATCDIPEILEIYTYNITIKDFNFINSRIPNYGVLIEHPFIKDQLVVVEKSSIINSSFGNYINLNHHYNQQFQISNFYMMNSISEDTIFLSLKDNFINIENVTIKNSSALSLLGLYNCITHKNIKIKNIFIYDTVFLFSVFNVSVSYLTIENANLNYNYFDSELKAIFYIYKSTVSIFDINIESNNGSPHYGYALVSSESIFKAKNVVFSGCSGELANSIFSYQNLYILLDNCSFIDSKLSSRDIISFYDKVFYIKNSLFLNSFKTSIRIHMNTKLLIISSTRFINIPLYAINLFNVPFAIIDSCIFYASPYNPNFNSLRMQGIYAELSNLDVHNSIFTNLRTDNEGSAITTTITFPESGFPLTNFRIWNSQFINCSASIGGAIFLSVEPKRANTISIMPLFNGLIIKSSFVNNTASLSGGAIAFSCDKKYINCKFNIADTVFSRNMVVKSESFKAVKFFYANISSRGSIAEKDVEKFESQIVGPPSIIKLTSKNKIIRIIEEKDCTNRAISKNYFI